MRYKTPDLILATDASLIGIGACCELEYLHARIPEALKIKFGNIAHYEMLAIYIAIKKWKDKLAGKKITLLCDNQACVAVVNSGRASDPKLAECLRQIVMITATNDIQIKLEYVNTKLNTIPDLLSRWYNNCGARHLFKSLTNNKMRRRSVLPAEFTFLDI